MFVWFTSRGGMRVVGHVGAGAYRNSQLLSNPRRHKPQQNPSNSNSKPVPCRAHPARELGAVAHAHEERHHPPADCDFKTDVAKEEEGEDPSDAGVARDEQGAAHASLLFGSGFPRAFLPC